MADVQQSNEAPSVSPPAAEPAPTIDVSKLDTAKLTLKQKKALGIVSKEETEKQKARNEALRERMRRINEERKKAREASKPPPPPPAPEKKKKQKKVVEEISEESESSSDEYIQRKAKKVKKTLDHLSTIEERLAHLRSQNSSNPYFQLLCR